MDYAYRDKQSWDKLLSQSWFIVHVRAYESQGLVDTDKGEIDHTAYYDISIWDNTFWYNSNITSDDGNMTYGRVSDSKYMGLVEIVTTKYICQNLPYMVSLYLIMALPVEPIPSPNGNNK